MIKNKKLWIETFAVIVSLIVMVFASIVSGTLSTILWASAFIIGGMAKAIEGVTKTIQERSLNVEFLMIAAALGAFLTREYAEGAILIFIFAVSGVLEEFALAQSEKALTNLLKVAPQTALKIIGEKEIVVPISELVVGDLVRVKTGQQVPADGVIHSGSASFNQSSITGEFIPVYRDKGQSVFGGAIAVDATVVVRVSKNPAESVVQKMIAFVKRAQEEKTKSEIRVSTFEKIYVYFVIALAVFVMFFPALPGINWLEPEVAFRRGIIVLVVASPCALVASLTPAILSTLSHGARKGILIKSGRYLEKLLKVNLVAFDKTGTITTGFPQVKDVVFSTDVNRDTVLEIFVNAERQSTHPLANAVSQHFSTVPRKALTTQERPGRGMQVNLGKDVWEFGRFDYEQRSSIQDDLMQAQQGGNTVILMVHNKNLIGFVTLKDTVRPEVTKAIAQLKQLNIIPMMLTGDNEQTAKSIAKEVGIDVYRSECLPEDKVKVLQDYKLQGKTTLMIGDGINDAPSLATADIGVAMGDGTDVSLETADIVMMNNHLDNLPYLISLTKKMKTIMNQNVVFSLIVIAILLISNLFGLIELTEGVLSHELSTILVIMNSLRLLLPIAYGKQYKLKQD
jgi:Cd2+/Zn2+-exporting ATPase